MGEKPVIEKFLLLRTEEAFCALFEVVCVRVRRYFLMRGLDLLTAEELTQNVLLKVWRNAQELRDADKFHGWLFRIARNEMVSWWRDQKQLPQTVALESLTEENSAALLIEHQVLSSLRFTDWLKALEPSERDLIILRFIEGLSYEELAEAFDIPLGTIKWRIFNARKKLAQIITATPQNNIKQRLN